MNLPPPGHRRGKQSRLQLDPKRLKEILSLRSTNTRQSIEELGIPYRTYQAWQKGALPNSENTKKLADGLGLQNVWELDSRYRELWTPIDAIETSLRDDTTHILPFTRHPLAGPQDCLRDRFNKWLPTAAETHIREMLSGIRLNATQQEQAFALLNASFRPERHGLSSTIYEAPPHLRFIPDSLPTEAEIHELRKLCQSPLQVWLPSLSYATPAVFLHAQLDGVCELNLNYAHSVILAGNLFVNGEPDVLVIGPQAYLHLHQKDQFRSAYQLVDRWHAVEVRALESTQTSKARSGSSRNALGKYLYSSNPHSTDGMIFRQLSSNGVLRGATGVSIEKIDPITSLRIDADRRVLAFVPFALAAEALGIGRVIPLGPRSQCGHPMLLLFHRRICSDNKRIGQLLLARLRHSWTALATSAVDREKTAANVADRESLVWSSFLGLNMFEQPAIAS